MRISLEPCGDAKLVPRYLAIVCKKLFVKIGEVEKKLFAFSQPLAFLFIIFWIFNLNVVTSNIFLAAHLVPGNLIIIV